MALIPSSSLADRSLDDESLILAVRSGDREAGNMLYRRLYPTVSRTLWRVRRTSTSEHHDLIQLTFERVVRSLFNDRFAGHCSLATWASAIACRTAVDSFRAQMRERRVISDTALPEELHDGRTADFERTLIARSELQRVRSALERMNPRNAEAVVLCDALGCSVREAADTAAISSIAIQSRLARARRELRRRSTVEREAQ